MRLKDCNYDTYNLNSSIVSRVLTFCRHASNEQFAPVLQIVQEVAPGIENDILLNIRDGWSYERISAVCYPKIGKVQFYAYRKKIIYLIWNTVDVKEVE